MDDVFVIVIFTALTSLATGQQITASSFLQIPISIVIGILVGILCGILLTHFFKIYHMRNTVKVLVLLGISFLLIECENHLSGIIPMSGLLAIMSTGIVIFKKDSGIAKGLSEKYNKLWVAAEVLLFVLVGATVDLNYALTAGFVAILVVLGALVFRMLGVAVCLFHTELSRNERIFCMIAYTPKATVQAAIGAIPLAMGLPCGQTVLTVAVLSILITAPFGAICVDYFYKRLLTKTE